MKRDPVDILIQLAFLEGRVTTHGLYEKTVKKRESSVSAPVKAREKLIARLEEILEEKTKARRIPLTVGSFLRTVQTERALKPTEVSARIGVPLTTFRMLEEDLLSPLKVPVESWKKFRMYFELSLEKLEGMIRRTHQLVFFQPSFKTTLARYKEKKGSGKKSQALKQAAKELYTKAKLALPQEEERKLSRLIEGIST